MKARTFRSKKAKGTRLETAFAKMLRDKDLDSDAQRMVLSGAAFGFETDIKTTLPYAFEAKNQETFKLWQFWEQTERGRKPFKTPVLVYSCNYRPIMCILTADDFLNILKQIKDLEGLLEEKNVK